MRQFSRRLFGADSREVREFLAAAAVELDRANTARARAHAERDALQNRLREVAAEVDRLRGQVAVAHEKITAHQAQEGLAAQVSDEREALLAEREVLRSSLAQVTFEVDRLRGQVAAAEEKIAGYQAWEGLAAQAMAERDALAAVRDSLQNRLREATTELQRLREQAAAARDKIAAYQARRTLAAQMAAERDALRKKLKDVTTDLHALREQVAAAQVKIAAYQAEDREIAQTLLIAQKASDDIVREASRQAEVAVSTAAGEAEHTIQAARKAAAETLRKAQSHAAEMVRAAEEAAATRLAGLQVEAEWVSEEARRTVAEVEEEGAQYVSGLVTQLETFVSDAEFLVTLGTLGEDVAESLETLTRLQHEARDEILPALHRLVQQIRERGMARQTSAHAPPALARDEAPASAPSDAAARQPSPPPSEGTDRIISTLRLLVETVGESTVPQGSPPAPPVPAETETPGHDRVVRLGVRGEIVVSPVRTHYRATKIAEAVSRMKGIRVARLRGLQEDAASIEAITEAGTLLGIDFTVIDGVPMDVVEATDARLVLRVARTLSQSIPG